jgi:hypothetical protein
MEARLGSVLLVLRLLSVRCTGPRHSAEPLRPFLSPSGGRNELSD